MWILPLIAALVSGFYSGVVIRLHSPGSGLSFIWWSIALLGLAVASACLFIGSLSGWSPFIARTYYLFGTVTLVAFFSVGITYLLAPRPVAHMWALLVVVVTALAAFILAGADVDHDVFAVAGEPGWKAIDRSQLLMGLTSALGNLGILVLITAAVFAYVYRRFALPAGLIATGSLILFYGGNIIAALGGYGYVSLGYLLGSTVIVAGIMMTAGDGTG